ncbi:hypothetical protein B296_00011950 [Ensete ventricosum]|uniref:beta-N-acetylhexosaminidase n=1 Tax=Ensete ventricosum TaxID=4639 RepID=A0A427AAA9_ENSVE|nr:hypothetical protein B296_00011950 [Ensete ventricosum]
MSNQGVWYLDHLDVPWENFYNSEPLEGINNITQQKLVLGGEVCMWGEMVDTSNVQQTIWPRAAAAAGMGLSRVRRKFAEGNKSLSRVRQELVDKLIEVASGFAEGDQEGCVGGSSKVIRSLPRLR